MTKKEFIEGLKKELSGLPEDEVAERLDYYSEMIDDRIEEGSTEEEAVCALGGVKTASEQIISEIPLTKIVAKKLKAKRSIGALEITLLVLGSPIWLSLAVAAFSVLLSLFAVLWSVVFSLWAVFVSLVLCGVCGIAAGIGFAVFGQTLTGVGVIAVALVAAGCAILAFFGCKTTTKGCFALTGAIIFGVKRLLVKKEDA